METAENNALIAKFMGAKEVKEGKNYYGFLVLDKKPYSIDELKYDSDWNWLMAVIEKIEEKCVFVLIGRMFCEITYTNPLNTNVHFEKKLVSGVRINAVYATCVEFIQWYNQKNQ